MANNNNVNQLPLTTNYQVLPTRITALNFLNEVVNNGLAPVHPDIQELNLYASVPDEVIANHQPNRRYFLLTPRATNADGTKFIYKTDDGMGEWIMEGETEEVPDGGQVIGFRSAFVFEYHQDYVGVQHGWRMTQLSLHQGPHQDAQQNNAFSIIHRV